MTAFSALFSAIATEQLSKPNESMKKRKTTAKTKKKKTKRKSCRNLRNTHTQQ